MKNYKYYHDHSTQDSLFDALTEIAETYVSPLSQAKSLRSYLISQAGCSEKEAEYIVRERFDGILELEEGTAMQPRLLRVV